HHDAPVAPRDHVNVRSKEYGLEARKMPVELNDLTAGRHDRSPLEGQAAHEGGPTSRCNHCPIRAELASVIEEDARDLFLLGGGEVEASHPHTRADRHARPLSGDAGRSKQLSGSDVGVVREMD